MKYGKSESKNKLFAALLSAIMVLLVVLGPLPQKAMTAYAASGDAAISTGPDILNQKVNQDSGTQLVSYAGMKWYVIGYDGAGNAPAAAQGAITLFVDRNTGATAFHSHPEWEISNYYAGSSLHVNINKWLSGGELGYFSEKEEKAIIPRTLEGGAPDYYDSAWDGNKIRGDSVNNAKLWPLSYREAHALAEGIMNASGTTLFWLRTNGTVALYIGVCGQAAANSTVQVNWPVGNTAGIRPAFHLNKDAVLLTSASTGGKESGSGQSALTRVGANSGNEWKLTLLDDGTISGLDGHSGFTKTASEIDFDSGLVTIAYSGAATGEGEYISAIVKDSSGAITYYGRIKNVTSSSDASGELTIDINGKMGGGDSLYVFNETCNGDGKTDYASDLVEVEIPRYSLTIKWSSMDEPSDAPEDVVIDGIWPGMTIWDALDDAGYSFSNPPFAKDGYREYGKFTPDPITSYADHEEMNAADVDRDTTVTQDLTLYYPMTKLIDKAEITLEAPLCGTEVVTANVNKPWEGQTNPPEITAANGNHYHLNSLDGTLAAWWVDSSGKGYNGTLTEADPCQLGFSLEAEFGYKFAVDVDGITVNGGSFVRKTSQSVEEYLEGIACVAAEHDWQEATCTEPRKCAGCEKTEGDALGHDWGEPAYTWTADRSSVTAKRICANDGTHVEQETVRTTSEVIKEPTETAEGTRTYTATFTNPVFKTQTMDVKIPKKDPASDPADIPNTGDGNCVVFWLALVAISLICLGTASHLRRRKSD